MAERGFLLTPTWRTVDGRPEVLLYAVLESGEPALILDDRARPYFFVRARDTQAARRAGIERLSPEPLRSFDGEEVARVEVATPDDVPRLREALARIGVECFEADVRFTSRYLIDRGLRGAFVVDGEFQRRPGVGRVYRNPRLAPASFLPRLRVLSLDIETSMDAERLFSIAVAGAGGERVFLIRDPVTSAAPDAELPGYVERFEAEGPLLERFLDHVRKADPDVLTGWSVPDFDLPAILRFCRRAGLRCELGRGPGEVKIRRDPGFTREARALLAGRVVLDGLALTRSSFFRLDDYRLETAAQAILGRGKLFGPEGRGHAIEASFHDDPAALAAYNLEDARLVLEILEKTGLVELAVRRSLLTGVQVDRVGGQIASVDGLYLAALRRRGRVAPSVTFGNADEVPAEPVSLAGGLVLDPVPGLYRNIAVFDFKSLYPSLIRTFNIDPLTYAGELGEAPVDPSLIRTPSGSLFRPGEDGILPALVARLWEARARARAAGDERGSLAIKILMNSLYGVLGSPASRLFSPPVANAIPLAGQRVIRLAADAAAAAGRRVLYGDTDSLFVDLGEPDPARAAARAEELRAAVAEAVGRGLAGEFGVKSFLELQLARIYARLFLPESRRSAQGSKKRYAGLVADKNGGSLEIVGLEAVRRDSSAVARRFQRELLERVFRDEPVAPFIRGFVADLRAGRLDAELVYRKALRKPLEDYTKTTPQHVKAARLLGAEAGRVVRYVVTRAGPEPVGATTAPPDYEHYVKHQLRAIAEQVLHGIGAPEFDEIIGAKRQLSLF